ncbi:hypothetical protein OP486_05590 [Clostridium kluyveri]|nr:hypothetical protein [Clostridium kluyveri]UZQ51650.1 hypothetical protein OP486_05590 [Clostridium kluyveri]
MLKFFQIIMNIDEKITQTTLDTKIELNIVYFFKVKFNTKRKITNGIADNMAKYVVTRTFETPCSLYIK